MLPFDSFHNLLSLFLLKVFHTCDLYWICSTLLLLQFVLFQHLVCVMLGYACFVSSSVVCVCDVWVCMYIVFFIQICDWTDFIDLMSRFTFTNHLMSKKHNCLELVQL